ncbi:MAG: hypothetical protein ABEJ02_03745 [Candidatus Paceibacteria bacterium]
MQKNYLSQLYKSDQTVFTLQEAAMIWGEPDSEKVKKRLYRYKKEGKLYSPRRGIYTKDKDYAEYELATKIYTPAYISLETVLASSGLIFQFYSQIFVISYLTREITVDEQTYNFRKIKDTILTNKKGVKKLDNYWVASTERAFLDTIYLNKKYYFDNLSPLDWDKVFKLLDVYEDHDWVKEKTKEYYQEFNQDQAQHKQVNKHNTKN